MPRLSAAGLALLKKAIEMSAKAFESYLSQASSTAASAAKTFLASPAVARATAVWDAVCGAQPPRPALARLARRFGIDVAETYGGTTAYALSAEAEPMSICA